MPHEDDAWGLVKKLDESFQQISSQLGLAIEGKIFQIMQSFDGQEIEKSLFLECPYKDKLILPNFKNIQPYRSPDNLIEIDLLAEDGEKWAVEIKWKNKATSLQELKKFLMNAKDLAEKLWFISKLGFTNAAIEFAKVNHILLSDQTSIEAIAKRLGVRFVR